MEHPSELTMDSRTSNSRGVELADLPELVLRERCPMLWDSEQSCDLVYMGRFIAGDEKQVLYGVANFAERLRKISRTEDFLQRMRENRSIGLEAYYTLIVLYCLIMGIGSLGSGMVVLSVLRKKAMKTARNLFILNLAISDLLLCLVTSPSTLMEILTQYWPLGFDNGILCKMTGGFQGICVFASSMSITAIALDRYQVIIYPTRETLRLVEVVVVLVCVWFLAVLLASPLFVVRELVHHQLNHTQPDLPQSFDICAEKWSMDNGRVYYSIFSLICQYVVPMITVSVAYYRITRKLRNRMTALASRTVSSRQNTERRTRRTNYLLISITVIYAVCWIPLNVCNLVFDLFSIPVAREKMLVVFAACHMLGMSSACSNPILYGWLNDNFRKEFVEIGQSMRQCVVGEQTPQGPEQVPLELIGDGEAQTVTYVVNKISTRRTTEHTTIAL